MNRIKYILLIILWFMVFELNAEEWEHLGLGFLITHAITVDPNDPNIIYAGGNAGDGLGGLYKTIDGGVSWQKLGTSTFMITEILINPKNSNDIYIGGISTSDVQHSTNGGETWVKLDSLLEEYNFNNFSSMAINQQHPDTLYMGFSGSLGWGSGGGGSLCTFDGGKTWKSVVPDSIDCTVDTSSICNIRGAAHYIHISYDKPNTIFMKTALGFFKSINYGKTWNSISVPSKSMYIRIHPQNDNFIYIVNSDECYISRNEGITWTNIYNKLPDKISIHNLYTNPCDTNEVIITGHYDEGYFIYKSSDVGVTWHKAKIFEIQRAYALTYSPVSKYLYVGILGPEFGKHGIYRIDTKTFTKTKTPLINKVHLLSSYPNPFNNSTQITYSLPSDTNVKLAVYNIKGELVSTLFNGFRVKGEYSHTFTANNLPSGIYFVRLETAEHIQTKKISLIQ